MFNRAYIYMALGAFFAQAVSLPLLASDRNAWFMIVASIGATIGLAVHELAQ